MSRRGRGRGVRAQVKHEQLLARIAENRERTGWMKYARCRVCERRFVCNNYADRRVRVNHLKYKGYIVCPWCRGRPEMYKPFVKMLQLLDYFATGTEDVDPVLGEKMMKKARKIVRSRVANRPS